MAYVIGLNSGSSLDSIDVVLLDLSLDDDGLPQLNGVLEYLEYPWPEMVHAQVLDAINLNIGVADLCRLNFVVGAVFADGVHKLLDKARLQSADVEVIGVDGQTIYQEPPDRERWVGTELFGYLSAFQDGRLGSTLQIGEGAVIAAATGIPTVTQFRPADMALGGTGAPVEEFLDFVHYRKRAPLVTLNIGGIANIHAVHSDRDLMMAFDTGPGNILMDRMAKKFFGRPYDKNGELARSGKINQRLLDRLLEHPFLRRQPPRSAWREDFGDDYLAGVIEEFSDVNPVDVMATLAEFTVQGILQALQRVPFLDDVHLLVGNGGGVFNMAIEESLARQLPPHIRFTLSDEFGIPAKANEAAKFGTLGFAAIHRIPGNIPHASGAAQLGILGKVHLPPVVR